MPTTTETYLRPAGLIARPAGLIAALVCLATLWAPSAAAQKPYRPIPRLFTVFPAGGQVGGTVEVEVTCVEGHLDGRLVFSHSGIVAKPKMRPPDELERGQQPDVGEITVSAQKREVRRFIVTIAGNVPPGIHEVRLASHYGISNSRAFCVGTLPELAEDLTNLAPDDSNHSPEKTITVKLGTVINGRVDGKRPDWFRFTAKKGQRVLGDCWTHRIDSRARLLLTVRDGRLGIITRSLRDHQGDTFVDFTVPADGDYYLTLHQFSDTGAPVLNNQTKKWEARNHDLSYRLTLSTGPHVDAVFPPSGTPGTNGRFTLYGRNLPGGKPANLLTLDGRPLDELRVQITLPGDQTARQQLKTGFRVASKGMGIDGFDRRWNKLADPVLISMSREKVVVESEPNNTPDTAQAIALPCEYVGRFFPRDDHDWVTFEAKQGDAFWIEVISHRLGLPLDPAFTVKRLVTKPPDEAPVKKTAEKAQARKWIDVTSVDDVHQSFYRLAMYTPGNYTFAAGTYDPWGSFVAPEDGRYAVLVRLSNPSRDDPRWMYRLILQRARQVERWTCQDPNQGAKYTKDVVAEKGDFRLAVLPWNFSDYAKPTVAPEKGLALPKGGTLLLQLVAFRRGGFQGAIEVTTEGLPAGVSCRPTVIGPWQTLAPLVLQASPGAAPWVGRIRIVGRAKSGNSSPVREARAATMSGGRARMVRDGLWIAVTGETEPFRLETPDQVWVTSRAGKLEIPFTVHRQAGFADGVAANLFTGQFGTYNGMVVNLGGKEFKTQTVTASGADGKLQFKIPVKHPPGTYSYFVRAQASYQYLFKPEILKRALARQEELQSILTERQAKAKKAGEVNTAAQKAVTAAQTLAKAALDKFRVAKPGEKAAAKKVADEAAAALQQKQEHQKATVQALAVANRQLAAVKKAKVEQDQRVEEAKKLHVPHKLSLTTLSTPITIRIAPAPIELAALKPVTSRQGDKIEMPITIKRMAGFNGPVNLSVKFSAGIQGLKVTAAAIPDGQTQGKIVFALQPDATPGRFAGRLTATANYNGQSLTATQPLDLTIEAIPKREK